MSHRMYIESAQIQICQDTEPGFVMPGESWDGYKLTWVRDGTLHSIADGQDTLLHSNELMIYGRNQWHMQYADINSAPQVVNIVFGKSTMDLSGLAGKKISPAGEIFEFFTRVLQELQHPDAYSQSMVLSALEMALMGLLRLHNVQPGSNASPFVHTENQIIRRAQQYVSAHIRDKLTVPLVAQKADVSPSYLTALFQKHLNISPGEYIRRLKLQESKALIKAGNMSFSEIADLLNYSTVHHFSRQFKEKFGITPTEYAKTCR